MKKFWKFLGVAALAVGFTPYHVEKDEETGERKVRALLWQMTRKPKEEEKEDVSISFGFNPPVRKDSEVHLFSDDLSVEYAGDQVPEEPAEAEATAAEEATVETPVVEEAPVVEEVPAAEKAESEESAPAGEEAETVSPVEA